MKRFTYEFDSYPNSFLEYRIRRCLIPSKQATFSQIREGGLENYYFFIFQNFTTFVQKEQLEGSLIITASYLKRKKNSSQ